MDIENKDELVSDGLVNVKEAGKFLCLARSTIYNLMDTGKLVFVKIGYSRRIPKKELIRLASDNLIGGWNSEGHNCA